MEEQERERQQNDGSSFPLEEYVLELSGPEKKVDVIRWNGVNVFFLHYLIEKKIKDLIEQAKFDGMTYQPEEFRYRLFGSGREILKGKFSPVDGTNPLCSSQDKIHVWNGAESWRMGAEITGKKTCLVCGMIQKTILSDNGHRVEYIPFGAEEE